MRIARVKLTGFKSFVDPVELRILPGLTGVVGPNGCGKSNLLEAIRWAMGEGSPKSLRGAAMDDVIFAGTATRPQRQFAEVSILAERPGDDDVEVVRRIERGAGSAYRINGRDARARDAQLIFADAATGAHSPALVSQGRIGSIIAAKPAERRAMLEEAAGIAGLHVRRREAEIRLKATEANLTRVGELLVDMDTRIAALRRQARSAERYRKLSDEIRQAEARLIFARWRDAAAAADAARAEAKAADEAVFAASEAQRAAAAWSNEAVGALSAARATAQEARDAAADARHRLATVEAERTRIDARIAELASQGERLEADLAREGDLARDANEAVVRLNAERQTLEARIAAADAQRAARATQVDRCDAVSRDAELALAKANAAAAEANAERRIAEASLATARSQHARLEQEQQRLKTKAAQLPDASDLRATLDRSRADCELAKGQAEQAAALIETVGAVRDAAEREVAKRERERAEAVAALAAFEREAKALAAMPESSGALAVVQGQPGYETALAAALADDLAADIGSEGEAQRRWLGAETLATDPVLSAGIPLANHVMAPPELQRRLQQIAVGDVDDGSALAVGQRFVTRAGALRRWDGFESIGTGAAEAERLVRRNRLVEIERSLPQAQEALASADQELAAARASLDQAAQALAEARAARDRDEAAARTALRALDVAEAEYEKVEAAYAEVALQIRAVAADLAQSQSGVTAAEARLTALPEGDDGAELTALDQAARLARDAIVGARAELNALDAGLIADRARMAAAQAEVEDWRARSGKAGKRVEEMAARAAAREAEAEKLADAPAQVSARAAMVGIEAALLADTATATLDAERAAEAVLRTREGDAARAGEALAAAREMRAGAQARAENQELRRIEMGRVSGERFECPPPVLPERQGFDAAAVGAAGDESTRLERLVLERERLGPVNLVAESELVEIEDGRAASFAEHAELTEATHRLRGSIGSLNREGRERLRTAFEAVDGHFRDLFKTLFSGGEAHLALVDSDDPLDAGLEIMAQPPGKKLTSLTLLSGGEQALTAVALIFALFLTNPAPLCVLDEVDAPLDDANVERFCDLLDAMAKDTATRYLIVTHNAVTMARMHRLYGVTMVEQGISRLVSVDLGGAEALLAAE